MLREIERETDRDRQTDREKDVGDAFTLQFVETDIKADSFWRKQDNTASVGNHW